MSNKELVRRFFEEFDFGRLRDDDPRHARLGEICAQDYRTHRLIGGDFVVQSTGLAEFQASVSQYMFPTWSRVSFRVVEMLEEGPKVSSQVVITGVIAGSFRGYPGNNTEVVFGGNNVVEIRDGKICGEWVFEDFYSVLQQIGAMPA